MSTLQFGPEWMRAKPVKPHAATDSQSPASTTPAAGASSYSALVSPAPPPPPEKRDESHPFRYSREEMLKIYRDGGGKTGLGLEVERWEGIVREGGSEPVGLREMGEAEKKLFGGPLNSDLRRRQSIDHLSPLAIQGSPGERPRLPHSTSSGAGSPMRERFGGLMRRRDSSDQLSSSVPRKLSLSGTQPPLSPRDTALQSPRTRIGHTATFDGVLGSSESWVARRRASEAKAAGNVPREAEERRTDIREEDEDASLESQSGPRDIPQTTESPVQEPPPPKANESAAHVQNGVDPAALSNGPPPGILDLAAVQWSYLDPQGQLQGPFRADLMQKWYDEGYFNAELLMKRTHLDAEWTAVGQLANLARSAGTEKIFLAPPGPPRSTDLQQNAYVGPLQPAPVRSLRSSTLEAYAGSSNHSDSPSSSFGAGRFGNGSPDPNAFGGRANSQYSVDSPAGRFGPSDSTSSLRRSAFTDSPLEPSASGSRFASGGLGDVYSTNGTYSPSQVPWQTPTNNALGGSFDGLNGGFASSSSLASGLGQAGAFGHIRAQDPSFVDVPSSNYADYIGSPQAGVSFTPNQQYSHLHSSPYIPSQEPVATANLFGQTAKPSIPSQPAPQNSGTPTIPTQSPWGTVPDSTVTQRALPLDTVQPHVNNVLNNGPTAAPAQASPWGTTTQTKEPSPWFAASHGVIDEQSWKEEPSHSLTFSNLGQHNQQFTTIPDEPAPVEVAAPPTPAPEISDLEAPAKPAAAPSQRTKARSKSTTQPVVPPPVVAVIPSAESTPALLAAPAKAAWTKEEEKKSKPSGVALSLRDIQDAEAKKAEARKQAERERERVARTAAPAAEEAQPFTASWGLPTSQAGARAAAAKETATPSPTTTSAPVWTNATKPNTTKKSMKEIQEEEEKRKKLASKETVAAAARRAYAESTSKAPSPAAQGGAWTTVGAGKTSAPVVVPARPPAVAAASSTSNSVPRVNGASVPRPATTPVKAPAPKIEEPVAASHDFIRWLNDSLKGLNNSVNVEEIMSMLLSFPLDPDVSTVELISDLIYANSTTLDGRRFAAEFVSKRKADAASRPKGASASGAGAGKPVSIADVVKAQPKPPASSEWGGFKVVNKKKKGGRS
ncbi:hypothetical protein FB45DRAFT_833102 [Roridomyces roridus]|uniref:GYF domain-containing protein n=1 Tax=Roridomyces roridus TaxID=1738132 RepID=A0AAD7BUN4_9AGAR|nr:hypothetical protein FB45DRAFT_833102 [Roridomyces roridus]